MAVETASVDCAALSAIHKAAFPHGWEEGPLRDLCLLEGMRLWLALLNGREVGFLLARLLGPECEVITFAVHPAYQGRAIGGWLLDALISLLKSQSPRRCYLEVAVGNAAALHLYRRHGFKQTGRRPGYFSQLYGEPCDAVSMTLEL